ncbi:MAG: zinc metallopeptidase [Thiomicrospira sp.]|uniref:zinc metallopeptidase n=1 Tax=Thiomicrospira sp. TaxID=935 RepID=UPI0019FF1A59|nr:zinc metallopeptidase [Thiomicrospira sp.]MBE0493045.1 zinc metallopeptidase [Thiomicrospira sp.]
MAVLIIGLVLLAIISFVPQWWTQAILKKHSHPHPSLPGSAHEFGEHLIRKYSLQDVRIEEIPSGSAIGDHYDPIDKVVRLSSQNFHSNSLTAIVTTAHEIGHAIQHKTHYEPLLTRTQMVERSQWLQKFSGIALMATPVLIPLMHTPVIGMVTFAAGFIAMGIPVLIHLSTLPVEFDASYKRALPLLQEGEYLDKKDMKRARHILTACAMTYVSSSLASLFNLWKWFSGFRR